MGLYDGWRVDGYPTLYPPNKTPVTSDVLEVGLIFAIVIIAFSLLLVIPGVRGRERLFYTIRVIVGVCILGCILLTNFGQEWHVAEIHNVPTQYKAGVKGEIHADIGVKIGLRSINVTLKGVPENIVMDEGRVNETINYNERFHWNSLGWVQGRGGFGPFAGLFNREYREAQLKGLPYPILWVAEYFTIDGEGIRFGRYYRQAGFYSHLMIWLAFPLWIIALILFKTTLQYASYFSMMTGGSLLIANILYATIQNPLPLEIPFSTEKVLIFHYGWCFWMNLVMAFLTILIGVVVFALDLRSPEALATFFNHDISQDVEEYYADPEDVKILAKRKTLFKSRKAAQIPSPNADVDNGGHVSATLSESGGFDNPLAPKEQSHFRKRTALQHMQKSRKMRARPEVPARKTARETIDYENFKPQPKSGAPGGPSVSYQSGQDNIAYEDVNKV